ncbi:MAG: hypothetical protein ACNA7M_17200, partial [Roseovarius sp.]
LHSAIEGFGPIRRFGMIASRSLGNSEDRLLNEPQIVTPAPDVLAGWPALPPAGQGAVRRKAQRFEQLREKPLIEAVTRACALLLLYWFT